MVLNVRMDPTLKALVTGEDHESKRASSNVCFRQQSRDVPYPTLDHIIVPYSDCRRPRVLNTFQQFVDPAPSDSHGLDYFYAEQLGESFLVNENATALGLIVHIEVKDDWHFHFCGLES